MARASSPCSLATLLLILGAAAQDALDERAAPSPLEGAALGAGGPRPARASPTDAWLRLVSEYARESVSGDGGDDEQFPRPVPISLPLGAGGRSVPVLVVPVPVPSRSSARECDISSKQNKDRISTDEGERFLGQGERAPAPRERRPPGPQRSRVPPRRPGPQPPAQRPPPAQQAPPAQYDPEEPPAPRPRPASTASQIDQFADIPQFPPILSSQSLVEMFRAQQASAPQLPPVLLPNYGDAGADDSSAGTELVESGPQPAPAQAADALSPSSGNFENQPQEPPQPPSDRAPAPTQFPSRGGAGRYQARGVRQEPARRSPPAPAPPAPPAAPAAPPSPSANPERPRFDRSLKLRGKLTVNRAGYTEPYTVWWDANSGAARVDFHNGASSTYRQFKADGRVQRVEVRVDRTAEREVRTCTLMPPQPAQPEDRALPGLPDLQLYSFAGYAETNRGRAEVWRHTLSGGSGELGAARGEMLAFRHELLLQRSGDNYTAVPLRYSVAVDSSLLGANCDNHVHQYKELVPREHDPALFNLDLDEACEAVVHTDELARVEPLREFTMASRDLRYDAALQRYKIEYQRRYVDATEEAVRKNVMVQSTRFVNSGNRQSGTFELGMNFLGDRLNAEREQLAGAEPGQDGYRAASFPHSRDQLAALRGRLPRAFDWRARGGVTPVKFQGLSCSSCWAFAVTGAVEGALFARTQRLVPLSEQCLVDCAHPYGGHGCKPTWPSSAYDYVRDRGLPALDEYTPYLEKMATCVDARVGPVTRISSHVNVTRFNVDALKVAIRRHSPTVVIVDAMTDSFAYYKKGVFYDDRCSKVKSRNHAVLAVGWGEQRKEPYFTLKNSWSSKWGEGGYMRVHGPANTCGVLTMPSYPHLERADVARIPPAPASPADAAPASPAAPAAPADTATDEPGDIRARAQTLTDEPY